MKIAVTGGSGQLGTHVLRRLVADRRVEQVVSVDLRPPLCASEKVVAVQADVRSPELARHFEGCGAVIHLAFLVVSHAPRDLFWGVNVEGSRNVFRAAVAAGARSIVYTSSIAAYGVVPGHALPLTEDSARVRPPNFPYSETKYEVEAFLDGFEKEHPDVAVARIRPSILIGARMEHPLGAVLRHDLLLGSADALWPFVWDEDVADAVVLAARHDDYRGARGAFNVSAESDLTLGELARRAGLRLLSPPRASVHSFATAVLPQLQALGVKLDVDPAWLEHGDVPMTMSCEKARAVLGWKPRCATSLEVIRHYLREVPSRTDLKIQGFMKAVELASWRGPDAGLADAPDARVHVEITGRGGGDYTFATSRGALRVERGAPRPPTSVVTLSDETLLALLAGRLEPSAARVTGRVRTEGHDDGAALLERALRVVRSRAAETSPEGWIARRMTEWFARGARP